MRKLDFNNSFLINKADYEIVNLLDIQEKGELMNAIFEYQVNNKIINFSNDKIKIVFYHMKMYFDDNSDKYNEKIKNTKSKAGIISGIKRSREYKLLLKEEEKQEFLKKRLEEVENLTNLTELTEINKNEHNLTPVNSVNSCLTQTNTNEHNSTNVNYVNNDIFIPNEKLTNININKNINKNINDNINDNININNNNYHHQSINQSFIFEKIETLEKFNEWLVWWRTHDDIEFEDWKERNNVSDNLLSEKIRAVKEYYSDPNNHTNDFRTALKKFVLNDLNKGGLYV